MLLGVEIGEMSDDESLVQSLPASPVPSMASDVEGTASAAPGAEGTASAALGADVSQVVRIQQTRKRIKAEQDLMKKRAQNDQQVLKERLKVAKLENKLLMEQEKTFKPSRGVTALPKNERRRRRNKLRWRRRSRHDYQQKPMK